MSWDELTILASSHEGAHLAQAILDGCEVLLATVDRTRGDCDGQGFVRVGFSENDRRSAEDRAAARARVALAGMLLETKGDPRASDADVVAAYGWAGAAGAADPGAWVGLRGDEVLRTFDTEVFRRLLDAASYALLERGTLGAEDVAKLVRSVPGATSAGIAAREGAETGAKD